MGGWKYLVRKGRRTAAWEVGSTLFRNTQASPFGTAATSTKQASQPTCEHSATFATKLKAINLRVNDEDAKSPMSEKLYQHPR